MRAVQSIPELREHVVAIKRQAGAGPVSYTHLRAHETVLDLVCRLLLEKKTPLRYVTAAHYLVVAVHVHPTFSCYLLWSYAPPH